MISEARQNILITGASGFIGSALMNRLAERFNVIAADIAQPAGPLPHNALFVAMDLTNDQSVMRAMQAVVDSFGRRLACVIHLAAYYDFSGEPSDTYESLTVSGTQRLLKSLAELDVEQFIFSSTMLVHAPCTLGETINEDSNLQPQWAYPRSKLQAEELIRRERGEIPIVLLRIAGVYDDDCHCVPLAHQMQRIYERRMTARVFPGDTSAGQAMVHMEDLIEAMVATIDHRSELPEETILLIGEDETVSYDELQRRFGDLIHGETWETSQIPKAVARTGAWFKQRMPLGEEPFIRSWMVDLADDHYQLDISRARRLLGWQPQRNLRHTLPKMVHALKRNPLKFYKEHELDPPHWLQRDAAQQRAET